MLRFFGNIIQLIFSPQSGWEDLERDDFRPDGSRGDIDIRHLYLRCFLPTVLLCSLTAFVRMAYGEDFLGTLQTVIIEFFSLFLSYHVAVYLFSWLMPRIMEPDQGPDHRHDAIMIIYCMAVIALIFLLGNIIKVKLAMIQLLPFYVVFIIWKGAGYIGVPERSLGAYMFIASASILGTVYGLSFLFHVLI